MQLTTPAILVWVVLLLALCAPAQAVEQPLLARAATDFVVVSDRQGYACSVEVDPATLSARLVVRQVALPSGAVGPATVVVQAPALVGTTVLRTCSLTVSADGGTAVVGFDRFTQPAGFELYVARVDLTTGTSQIAEVSTSAVTPFDSQVLVRRAGTGYYIAHTSFANTFLLHYFDSFAALIPPPGVGLTVNTTATTIATLGIGTGRVRMGSADLAADSLDGPPAVILSYGIDASSPGTQGVVQFVAVDGVLPPVGSSGGAAARWTIFVPAPWDDVVDFDMPGRVFASRAAIGDFLALTPTFGNGTGPRLFRLDYTTGGYVGVASGRPSTLDVALDGSDWVIASRDKVSQMLSLKRIPTTSTTSNLSGLDALPDLADSSSFCGATEAETPINTATWWRDQNNFVEVQRTPNGTLAAAHHTCASGAPVLTVATVPVPGSSPPPPPPPPVTAAVVSRLLCAGRTIDILELTPRGRTVRVFGVTLARHAGRTVTLTSFPGARAAGTARVRADGTFVARVKKPSAKQARLSATIGGRSSRRLALTRRFEATTSGNRVTLRVRGAVPTGSRVTITRLVSCAKQQPFKRVAIPPSGIVRLTVPKPAKGAVAIFRATTRIRSTTGARKTFATFTLPIVIRG